MFDPTREEMNELLDNAGFTNNRGYDSFDRQAAIYWFANNWHGGQWTNLYSVLSTSLFRPSTLSRGIESDGDSAKEIYDFLESTYTATAVA